MLIWIFVTVVTVGLIADVIHVRWLISIGRGIAATAVPFQRDFPDAPVQILVLGDSTAVGTGASSPELSLPGRLAAEFPQASLLNFGKNGQKVGQLAASFPDLGSRRFTLTVVQIGGNDILRMTPKRDVETGLRDVLTKAKGISDHVILLHTGNVGAAPFFPWPFHYLFTAKTRQIRALSSSIATEFDVTYVDLFKERKDDVFLTDPSRYYAADMLHPSGEGYRVWYETFRRTMNEAGLTVPQS